MMTNDPKHQTIEFKLIDMHFFCQPASCQLNYNCKLSHKKKSFHFWFSLYFFYSIALLHIVFICLMKKKKKNHNNKNTFFFIFYVSQKSVLCTICIYQSTKYQMLCFNVTAFISHSYQFLWVFIFFSTLIQFTTRNRFHQNVNALHFLVVRS